MAESDDGSFFEEPVFRSGEEEPETQALDFGDELQVVEDDGRDVQEVEDDDRDSPFIAQMPVTPPPAHLKVPAAPPTTPSKIAQFASKMGMVSHQVEKPSNATAALDDVDQRPTTSIMKRSAKITLSPTKTIKRKRFVKRFVQESALVKSVPLLDRITLTCDPTITDPETLSPHVDGRVAPASSYLESTNAPYSRVG